jgi:hypothetical protein
MGRAEWNRAEWDVLLAQAIDEDTTHGVAAAKGAFSMLSSAMEGCFEQKHRIRGKLRECMLEWAGRRPDNAIALPSLLRANDTRNAVIHYNPTDVRNSNFPSRKDREKAFRVMLDFLYPEPLAPPVSQSSAASILVSGVTAGNTSKSDKYEGANPGRDTDRRAEPTVQPSLHPERRTERGRKKQTDESRRRGKSDKERLRPSSTRSPATQPDATSRPPDPSTRPEASAPPVTSTSLSRLSAVPPSSGTFDQPSTADEPACIVDDAVKPAMTQLTIEAKALPSPNAPTSAVLSSAILVHGLSPEIERDTEQHATSDGSVTLLAGAPVSSTLPPAEDLHTQTASEATVTVTHPKSSPDILATDAELLPINTFNYNQESSSFRGSDTTLFQDSASGPEVDQSPRPPADRSENHPSVDPNVNALLDRYAKVIHDQNKSTASVTRLAMRAYASLQTRIAELKAKAQVFQARRDAFIAAYELTVETQGNDIEQLLGAVRHARSLGKKVDPAVLENIEKAHRTIKTTKQFFPIQFEAFLHEQDEIDHECQMIANEYQDTHGAIHDTDTSIQSIHGALDDILALVRSPSASGTAVDLAYKNRTNKVVTQQVSAPVSGAGVATLAHRDDVAPPEVSHMPRQPESFSDHEYFRQVYNDFVAWREKNKESANSVTLEIFVARLQKERDKLIEKYRCESVRFEVYMKDGRVAVRATPRRK